MSFRRAGYIIVGEVVRVPHIDEYGFGRIVIDGHKHTKDVIILPDRVVGEWWRKDGHGLVIEDLEDVLDDLPGRLVIGKGAYGRLHPDLRALAALQERGIEVEVLETRDAVARYGQLDESITAAALHLTC